MAQRFSAPLRAKTGSKPQVEAPKSVEQYLQDLDLLLKRNTGSGTFIGQDTSSNTPMYLPGQVSDPTGLGQSAPSVSPRSSITPPAPVERDKQLPPGFAQAGDHLPFTAEEFLNKFNRDYNQGSVDGITPEKDQINYSQGMASTPDGGVMGQDGLIHYPDGSVRRGRGDANANRSIPGGNIGYDDGSTREERFAMGSAGYDPSGRKKLLYNDQSIRTGDYLYQDNGEGLQPGLEGLKTGVFGQALPTTQPYGNVNPGMGYANDTHRGTDLRTRNLTGEQRNFKLPVNAQVVEVITEDQGSPYGNSILLQLPDGQMLRFSHLSQVAQVQPGQTIQAGQVFGMPGSTGNSDGEHLDLEYYNAQGQIDDPQNFDVSALRVPVPGQQAPGTVIQPPPQPQGQILGATNEAPTPQRQVATNLPVANDTVDKAITNAGQVTANAINKVNPTGKYGIGFTETMQQNPEAAREEQLNTIENLGTKLNAPELNTGELSREQGTNPFRQAVGNLVDEGARRLGVRTDLGLSELIAGGKTTNTDQGLIPKANASEGAPMSKMSNNPLSKPGEGVSALASEGTGDLQNVFKTQQPKETRAVGEVKGTVDESGNPMFSSLMDTAQSKAGMPKNDIRDSFFKMGGAEMFKQYMNPGVETNGALTLDLFNNDFYKDLGNISSVFGGSKDLGAATQKFVEFEKQKYPPMSRMDNNGEYEQGSLDEYNNSLTNYFNTLSGSTANAQSIFTPRLSGSSKNVFAGTAPMSKPSAPMSRPTASKPNAPAPMSVPAPTRVQASYPAFFSGPNQNASPSPQTSYRAITSGPNQNASPVKYSAPAKAPMSVYKPPMSVSAPKSAPMSIPAPKPQSQPVSNVFSAVKSFINNIFRR